MVLYLMQVKELSMSTKQLTTECRWKHWSARVQKIIERKLPPLVMIHLRTQLNPTVTGIWRVTV